MLEIVICDTDARYAAELEERIRDFYRKREQEICIQVCMDEAMAGGVLGEDTADVVFLNTRIQECSGFELAKCLRRMKRGQSVPLVFLSDHHEDVFGSLQYQPFAYLRKEHVKEELNEILERLWETRNQQGKLEIWQHGVQKVVWLREILFCESQGHYVYVNCVHGVSYRFRGRLADYEKILLTGGFLHPAKRYLVNCAFIASVGEKIVLKDGTELFCSKARRIQAKRLFETWQQNHSDIKDA